MQQHLHCDPSVHEFIPKMSWHNLIMLLSSLTFPITIPQDDPGKVSGRSLAALPLPRIDLGCYKRLASKCNLFTSPGSQISFLSISLDVHPVIVQCLARGGPSLVIPRVEAMRTTPAYAARHRCHTTHCGRCVVVSNTRKRSAPLVSCPQEA